MNKKSVFIFSFLVALTTPVHADFQFGIINAVKDAAKKLDEVYVKQGGPVPNAPSNVSALSTGPTQIRLTWTDNSTNEFGFKIERKSGSSAEFSLIATLATDTTFYVDSGVTPNTNYYYYVKAYNDTGAAGNPVEAYAKTLSLSITHKGFFSPASTSVEKVCVSGNYAYMACGSAGLIVADISNPVSPVASALSAPEKLAVLDTTYAYDVFASGNYVYIADGSDGLRIIDVSNPGSPAEVGSYDTNGTAQDVIVSGNYAYIADGSSGILIIDISNPSSPLLKGSFSTSDARGLFLSGNYLYVADGTSGLKILDVTNPTSLTQKGSVGAYYDQYGSYVSFNLRSVCVSGNYAYCADTYSGMRIWDVSQPAAPFVKSTYDTLGTTYEVFLKGSNAYIADYGSGLCIVSIADPANPIEVGNYDTSSYTTGIFVYGQYVYLADSNGGLRILSTNIPSTVTTAPSAPSGLAVASATRSRINITWKDNADTEDGFSLERKTLNGTYAQIASLAENVVSYSDSNLTEGTSYYYRIRSYNSIGSSSYSTEIGPALLSALGPIGSYNTSGISYDVFVSSIYAYVADGEAGLSIFDISNPRSPVLLGTYDTAGSAQGVFVSGRLAYIADGSKILTIVDVSNPSAPSLVGSYDSAGYAAYDISVSGGYAYLATYYGHLIINVSNPAAPTYKTLTYTYSYGNSFGIQVAGNTSYMADDSNGVKLIDISNLSNVSTIGSYTSGSANDIFVNGSYIYVAAGSNGLRIFDISNPSSLVLKGGYDTLGNSNGVFFAANYAYIADETAGIRVINTKTVTAPVEEDAYDTLGSAYGVFVKDGYTYVADGTFGLEVYQFDVQPSTASIPDAPSGFHVTKTSHTSVELAWDDMSSNETGFVIYRTTSPASYGTAIATVTANGKVYINTGLTANTTYFYRIKAVNGYGTSLYSNSVLAYTPRYSVSAIGSVAISGISYHDVFVTTRYAYMACQTNGFHIIDISTPTAPTMKGQDTSKYVYCSYVTNNKAYLGTQGDLTILDVSTPTAPSSKGSVNIGGNIYGLKVVGNKAYAASSVGLKIFNITDPANPSLLAGNSTLGYDLEIVNNFVYYAAGNSGLQIYNLATSTSTPVGTFTKGGSNVAYAVKVVGNYAYIAYRTYGLIVVDISNPSSPVEVGSYLVTNVNAYDIAIKGNFAIIDDNYRTLRVLDISNHASITDVATFTTSADFYSFTLDNKFIYLANSTLGLRILRNNLP